MQNSATILTLDAGGTNFVFSAIKDYKEIATPIILPAHADDLEKCLATIISGFEQIVISIKQYDAISFAFPGPADYALGIIGDLPNFKSFNGHVALGPMLSHHFNVPVHINNDGNLFALGVARAGYLPYLNDRLLKAGAKKQFKNLIGITLGTGFGCGIVSNGQLLIGDNSCAAEIHNTLNTFYPEWNAEEGVSTRAIQRVYASLANITFNAQLMPKDIYQIAKGLKEGNSPAAKSSFIQYGKSLGSSIANVLTLIDGIIVIGGGLSASWDLFSPSMFLEINRQLQNFRGEHSNRLSFKVFNLEDEKAFEQFALGEIKTVPIPGTDKVITYDSMQRSGVALSNLDASFVTALGAYDFALQHLPNRNE
jgi:glucokinase